MNSPSQQRAALDECRTLLELGRAARSLGLRQVLEEPVGALAATGGLTPRPLALLARMAATGTARTLGELLSQGPAERFLFQEASPRARTQLLEAARRRLKAAIPDQADGPKGPPLPPLPESRRELEAWADGHGVRHLLSRRATELGPHLGGLLLDAVARGHAGAPVGDLVLAGPWSRGALALEVGPHGIELIRQAAWRWLHEEADALHHGKEEEEKLAALQVPDDPILRRLFDGLLSLRRQLRAEVSPRAAPPPLLDFVPDPPAFVAETEPKIFPPAHGRLAEVRIDLGHWEKGSLGSSCTCGLPICVHRLQTVDGLLQFLLDPAAEGARRPILAELAQPAWARTLKAIERTREKRERLLAEQEEIRISWRLFRDVDWILRPFLQKQTKRGWSTGSRVSFPELAARREALDPVDRKALEALASGDLADAGAVPDALLAPRTPQALQILAGHPRVHLGNADEPLEVVRGTMGIAAIEVAGGAEVQPTVGGEPIGYEALFRTLARSPAGSLALHVDTAQKRCVVFPVDDEVLEILRILHQHGTVFPPEGLNRLLGTVAPLEERLPVALPPPLQGEEVEAKKDIVLRLEPLEDAGLKVDVRVRLLPGSPAYPPGEGPKELAAADGARRFFVRRDLQAEPRWVRDRIFQMPIRDDAEDLPFTFLLDQGDEALELLFWLQEHGPTDVHVEWPGRRRTVRRVGSQNLQVRVEKTRDWFGVDGGVELDGEQVRLAVLLDAARSGARWVEVRDGVWVQLEAELLARLRDVSDHVAENRGKLVAGIAAAPALEALGSLAEDFQADAALHDLVERIRTSVDVNPEVPTNLRAELRPYQIEGFRWMARLASWGAGAVLADDMGLGKTIQALALLLQRSTEGPALVIAPTSVGGNWVAEAARFAPDLKVHLWREADREGLVEALGPGDVVVSSYGLVVRDAELLSQMRFSTLILDEAQAVKNPATQRARAVRRLDADFRVALTGTPLENHLGELWSLFHLVFPGLLGSWQRFRERFALPIEKAGIDERRQALARVIRPFLLRRTKNEVAKELPPRIEIQIPIELSDDERRLYEDARLAAIGRLSGMADETGEQKRFEVLAAISRLRQCASHPRLYDPASLVASSKLARLMQLVEELREEGHRALIFSQFTSHLALVREALDQQRIPYLYLDGQTPAEKRDNLVSSFQAGVGDLFLISLKAGGTGLNLTAASYVIHLDPWWNPAVEDQATDRAHRIGQDKPVTVLRLVSRGTIEEAILALHEEKRELVSGILEGTGDARTIGTDELIALLRQPHGPPVHIPAGRHP